MYINVESITEHEDGSATVVFDMDQDTLRAFAQIGLQKVLTETAEATITAHEGETK